MDALEVVRWALVVVILNFSSGIGSLVDGGLKLDIHTLFELEKLL